MALAVVWLHVVGVVVWMGGLFYQSHVLLPAARRSGEPQLFVTVALRARLVSWVAACLVVLTGFYNVTQLGGVERVMESGAGEALAAKFFVVLVMISLIAHRDFAQLPRLASSADPATLRKIAILDHTVLLLGLGVIYLGLTVSRLGH
jgi:uncharacterized membrane protein